MNDLEGKEYKCQINNNHSVTNLSVVFVLPSRCCRFSRSSILYLRLFL